MPLPLAIDVLCCNAVKSPQMNDAVIITGTTGETAELLVDRKSNMMAAGKGIIIPAHTSLLLVQAAERFKMMRTVIKSGYES